MDIRNGLTADARQTIAEGLEPVLAETYELYLTTQNYHWNVTGNLFLALHDLFEVQYTELATAVDEIAERIRSLGHRAPGSFEEFQELSDLPDSDADNAQEMVQHLVACNEAVVRTCREAIDTAEEHGDDPTADVLIARIQVHEKAAWMLRSLFAD
ncbi:MAG: DNA starvation/stationary phase protection protein [Acidobacteriota bacterium]